MTSSFVIHTGNLNDITEIVTRRHKEISVEIAAALKQHRHNHTHFQFKNGIYSPQSENRFNYPRGDMRTTLKLFLPSIEPAHVESAVDTVLESVDEKSLSSLIVDFPKDESDNLEDSEWLKEISLVWNVLEDLVDQGKVHLLGVSDLSVDRLRLLVESAARHPPQITHFSIDGCCTVPPELVAYAKKQEIQLLTHNDARLMTDDNTADIREQVQNITGRLLDGYERKWTARYTVWLRSRSIVAGKEYFVQFAANTIHQ